MTTGRGNYPVQYLQLHIEKLSLYSFENISFRDATTLCPFNPSKTNLSPSLWGKGPFFAVMSSVVTGLDAPRSLHSQELSLTEANRITYMTEDKLFMIIRTSGHAQFVLGEQEEISSIYRSA
jgi:hypothetical protein